MKPVLVTYYSKTGNTAKIAKIIADELQKGLEVQEAASTEVIVKPAAETTVEDVIGASAIAYGSPDYFSYMAGHLKVLFDDLWDRRREVKDMPAIAFLSHGGGGKAVKVLADVAKWFKFQLCGKIITVQQAPGPKDEQGIRAAAQALLAAILEQ